MVVVAPFRIDAARRHAIFFVHNRPVRDRQIGRLVSRVSFSRPSSRSGLEGTFLCKSLPGPTVTSVDDDDERGTPSVCAEALTREMAETDGSSLEIAER